jgi:hypothetical protein
MSRSYDCGTTTALHNLIITSTSSDALSVLQSALPVSPDSACPAELEGGCILRLVLSSSQCLGLSGGFISPVSLNDPAGLWVLDGDSINAKDTQALFRHLESPSVLSGSVACPSREPLRSQVFGPSEPREHHAVMLKFMTFVAGRDGLAASGSVVHLHRNSPPGEAQELCALKTEFAVDVYALCSNGYCVWQIEKTV